MVKKKKITIYDYYYINKKLLWNIIRYDTYRKYIKIETFNLHSIQVGTPYTNKYQILDSEQAIISILIYIKYK